MSPFLSRDTFALCRLKKRANTIGGRGVPRVQAPVFQQGPFFMCAVVPCAELNERMSDDTD